MTKKIIIKRIGITMRTENIAEYNECRDSLAHDWPEFMSYALPEVEWIPISNIGNKAVSLLKKLDIQGIILSGGNDIGSSPTRDATEKALVSHAISNSLPIFGVCRGMQLIQKYFNGTIENCPRDEHVAKKHDVIISKEHSKRYGIKKKISVNSYHSFGIRNKELNSKLESFASTSDGWVEGVFAEDSPIVAVMWHPERGRPFRKYDRALARSVFGLKI